LMLRPDELPSHHKEGKAHKEGWGGGMPDMSRRLMIGAGGSNQIFTHFGRACARASMPLGSGTTYLFVAKVVASGSASDQVFLRVYGPGEPIGAEEPGSWTVVSPQFRSDLVFDWLGLHVNSMHRQMIDEIRVGTTWSSVTAPWVAVPREAKP